MLLIKFNLRLGFVFVNFHLHHPRTDLGLEMLLLETSRLLLLTSTPHIKA